MPTWIKATDIIPLHTNDMFIKYGEGGKAVGNVHHIIALIDNGFENVEYLAENFNELTEPLKIAKELINQLYSEFGHEKSKTWGKCRLFMDIAKEAKSKATNNQ